MTLIKSGDTSDVTHLVPRRSTGVKTANVHDLFVAENGKLAAVRAWWDLTENEVEAAVEFERHLAA